MGLLCWTSAETSLTFHMMVAKLADEETTIGRLKSFSLCAGIVTATWLDITLILNK